MSTDPLVRYLQSPSPSHFVSLVEETAPRVLGAAYRVLRDRSLAEDVTQDVYVKVLTESSLPGDGKIGSISLLIKAKSAAMTKRRSECRRLARERTARREREARANGGGAFSSEDIHDVCDAVAQLPPALRGAVELCYFAGLGLSEAAQVSGTSRHEVAALLQRAIKSLRTRLTASAAALILPALEGTGEAALPAIAVSEAFAARLRDLPSRVCAGKMPSRRVPSRLVTSGVAAAAIVAVALSLLGLAGLATLDGGRGGGRGREVVAGDGAGRELVSDDAAGAAPGGKALAAAPAAPAAAGEGKGDGQEGKARGQGQDAAAGQPGAKGEDDTSVVLRVIDENGLLLDDGVVDLELAKPVATGRLSPGKQWEKEMEEEMIRAIHLESRLLSKKNPIVLAKLPPAVLGREFRAMFRWGNLDPERSVAFKASRGEQVEVDLVVPARPRRDIVVVDAATREPIAGAFAWPTDRASLGPGQGHFIDDRGAVDPMVSTPPLKADALGRCTVLGAPGRELELKVWADGYVNAIVREEALGADGVVRLEPRGGNLSGSLSIRLLAASRWRRSWLEIKGRNVHLFKDIDAAGRVVFEKLEPGTYVIKLANFSESARIGGWVVVQSGETTRIEPKDEVVGKDEECAFTTVVAVRAGEKAEVTLGGERPRSVVTVNVVDELGRPREGVKVKLACVLEGFHATTDAGGRAVLEEVPPEDCFLQVGDEGAEWDAGKVSAVAGEPMVRSFVLGRGIVRGRVLAPPGKELPELVRVGLEGPLSGSCAVAGDGSFEIEGALPGTYRMTALEPGHMSEPVDVVVPHAGNRPLVEVELELRVKAGEKAANGDSVPSPGRS